MNKRLVAALLALIMVFALASCASEQKSTTVSLEPLTKDDVIEVTISSHASWPYREDWKVWEYIAEGSGATVNVTAIPGSDAGTKYSLMFAAPDNLPDVVSFTYKPDVDKYVSQGAFVAFEEVEEYMPNYNAWLKTLTEEEYAQNVELRKAYDGKIYYSPVIGREMSQNVRAWLYRKDIFDKHNISAPTTFEELYEACRKLKSLYPSAYPYCTRSKFASLDISGSSWKPYWTTGLYYDYNEEKWSYGAAEDIMLEVLRFYKRMVDEELMPSDFMTISATTWQELITTDRGFISPEYQTRIDFFNSLARQQNPEFDFHAMVPPIAKEDTGLRMVNKFNVDPVGIVMCNTGDDGRIANAAKFVDWYYSDEGYEMTSWGVQGETYEVVDGKKQYIVDEAGTQANTLYGFGTYGSFTRMDPAAVNAFESKDIAETRDMVLEHTMPYANPTITLGFNEEEQKVRDNLLASITSYAEENLAKFILGQKPLSEFDSFVTGLYDMGLNDILGVYTSAYSRIK